jgi:hypothetical protein
MARPISSGESSWTKWIPVTVTSVLLWRDVLVAGWTMLNRARRKEDGSPTLTTFRLDFGHEAMLHPDGVVDSATDSVTIDNPQRNSR